MSSRINYTIRFRGTAFEPEYTSKLRAIRNAKWQAVVLYGKPTSSGNHRHKVIVYARRVFPNPQKRGQKIYEYYYDPKQKQHVRGRDC